MQKVASRACIDMLGEIWADSKAPAGTRQAAYVALSNMWKDASPQLKERIRSIYTAVEGKAPDSISPVLDVD
jgi:hypothetical protein